MLGQLKQLTHKVISESFLLCGGLELKFDMLTMGSRLHRSLGKSVTISLNG